MDFNRRRFLLKSALAGTGLLTYQKVQAVDLTMGNGTPVVVATWDNQDAVRAANDVIEAGSSALDAVEAGARVPEADPKDKSVGYGGLPDADGVVTLDACIMDHLGNAGSVTYLQQIKHPISVARKVMEETPHVMLSGQGALEFALEQGFKKENLLTEASIRDWEQWSKQKQPFGETNFENHDTIGILAIDRDQNIAGACTTSGMAFKRHGRVGDSPIIGAGMYVDNEIGGACATGVGEYVMKTLGSFLIVELMRQGRTPQEACEEAIKRIVTKHPRRFKDFQVGYLALNKQGDLGAFGTEKGFEYTLSQNGKQSLNQAEHYLK
jgi:N4-(beta-N-acetylglucosaminyl)-L-asparaginase